MNEENATPAANLLPCPLCGCAPVARWSKCNPRARCRTEGCIGAKLPVISLDLPEDIAAWNRRTVIAAHLTLKQPSPAPAPAQSECRGDADMPVVAYGDRLGSHLQSAWCIPDTGVPPWMSTKEPLVKRSDAQAALAAKDAEIAQLTADLTEVASTLRRYEKLHRAKGTAESTEKAEVNAALAARFEATIAKESGK